MDTKGGGWSVGAAGPIQQPDCVGVDSRGRGAGLVTVPNSSSLYTLFYYVIFNSVIDTYSLVPSLMHSGISLLHMDSASCMLDWPHAFGICMASCIRYCNSWIWQKITCLLHLDNVHLAKHCCPAFDNESIEVYNCI